MSHQTAPSPPQPTGTFPHFTTLHPPTPQAAREARLLARAQLLSWGWPLDPAENIVGELTANAATHGRVPDRGFRLTLYTVGDTLRIEVTDTLGDHLPRLTHPRLDHVSGRGLFLVEALADTWGVSGGPYPRKTVWAEVRAERSR
ncbi:ATP-binding protein [Streptomyces sp. NPDC093252]|uniref:ATP-binding protein n=1 Tax=Streptomyces sp. NPDC093252 TaxID=3154980 RepID=UPI00341EC7D2